MGLAGQAAHAHPFTSHLAGHGSFLPHRWILSKGTHVTARHLLSVSGRIWCWRELEVRLYWREVSLAGTPGGRDKGEQDAVDPS